MENTEKKLSASEKITAEMIENKDFCSRLISCKDREEVKKFLSSEGIEADDNDIDDLARSISEVADICRRLDENELENVVGGVVDSEKIAKGALKGTGIAAIVVGGIGVLAVVAAKIKKVGDEKGWWNKDKNKKF